MDCENKITVYVPKGWSYKAVEMPCGSTQPDGTTGYCETCTERYNNRYPQGWRNHPGDICPHGTYVGDASGADYLCWECESA